MAYTLDLFGGIALEGPDGPVTGRVMQRHPLALLSVLATSSNCTCGRDRLIGLLWADQPEDRARHNLSDTLYVIHRCLGEAAVQVRGDLLHLDSAHLRTDVCEFEAAIAGGRMEDAVALCRGPLLDGFHLSGNKEFEEWSESRRRFYAFKYGQALEHLARQAELRGDVAAGIEWWQQRARHSPYNSAIARICVQGLLTNGDPGDAVRFAREHNQRLRDDLGVDAPADLVAVAGGDLPFKASTHKYDPPPQSNPALHVPSPRRAHPATPAWRRYWLGIVVTLAAVLAFMIFWL